MASERPAFFITVLNKERMIQDRKSTRLNSSHSQISYAVFCLKKKKKHRINTYADIFRRSFMNLSLLVAAVRHGHRSMSRSRLLECLTVCISPAHPLVILSIAS